MTISLEYKSFTVEASGNILHGKITGKLEKEDYDTFVPLAEELINKQGKIRVLFELIDFEGWSAGAAWEDCKFAYHHLKDIERMAIIGDSRWEKGMTLFAKPFMGAKLRYFDVTQREDAIDWIQHRENENAAA